MSDHKAQAPEPMDADSLELFGQIISANAAASHAASNRVVENLQRELGEWQGRFLDLFDAVADANVKTDSLRIGRILEQRAWYADAAAEAATKAAR